MNVSVPCGTNVKEGNLRERGILTVGLPEMGAACYYGTTTVMMNKMSLLSMICTLQFDN